MQRIDLQEIRERTYKQRDAWWTVLLVDPVAVHLVRLVAPYRWITPNLLSALAFVFGVGSAYAFWQGSHGWLAIGALLFHLSFVIDCMDGKIARLNGTGTMFGAWFDFIFDRLRVVMCTIALMGGQYQRTGEIAYVWLASAVIAIDLFRYLNSSQMAKIKKAMSNELKLARGIGLDGAEAAAEARAEVDGEAATSMEDGPAKPATGVAKNRSTYVKIRDYLNGYRIRTHVFSGIEYEMTVFIIAPLTFWVLPVTIAAGALLLIFETALIVRLYQATQRYYRELAKIKAAGPAVIPAQRAEEFDATAPTGRVLS